MAIIEADGLHKSYRSSSRVVAALDGFDLSVDAGTITGLLGPNGAGKTTAVKVLTTLVKPDRGSARVVGLDVTRDARKVRRLIGSSGQYAAVDEQLTGRENLEMVGRLYHVGVARARQRAAELLEMFDLEEAADRPVKGFSGGMRRRIDLAGALVVEPQVLFLDEPTTGLDPRSRIALWDVIRRLVSRGGTTVLLTTQYLEEADQLADTVCVVDSGRVIAQGTPDELKDLVGGHRVVVTVVDPADATATVAVLGRHGDGEPVADDSGREVSVPVRDGPAALQRMLADLQHQQIRLHDAGLRRPALDDVFLKLTGHETEKVAT